MGTQVMEELRTQTGETHCLAAAAATPCLPTQAVGAGATEKVQRLHGRLPQGGAGGESPYLDSLAANTVCERE